MGGFRCGAGGNIPAEGIIELKAGDKVYGPLPTIVSIRDLTEDI
jgi:hypothetical protein